MPYALITPWESETWIPNGDTYSPYGRLAARKVTSDQWVGTRNMTDIGRGVTLIVNGTTVTQSRYPYQDDLAAADAYYLGGHNYVLTDAEAQILIDAGYSDYLTPVV